MFKLQLAGEIVGQIGTTQIAPGSITTPLLAANCVTAANIAAGTIKAGIVDGTTITGAKIVATGSSGEFLAYTGTPAAGNLLIAISGAVGSDGLGNFFQVGLNVLPPTGPASLLLALTSGVPVVSLFTGETQENTPGQLFAKLVNPGAAQIMQTTLAGAKNALAGHNDFVAMRLRSSADDGSAASVGQLLYTNASGVAQTFLTWASTGVKVFDGFGSSTAYNTERQTIALAAAVSITTTAQTQLGATMNLAVGDYLIEGQLVISPAAAGGTAAFQFSGGGGLVVGSSAATWEAIEFAASPFPNLNSQYSDPGYQVAYVTPTLPAVAFLVRFRFYAHVTTAGTLALFATEAGGGSYTVQPRVSHFNLYPVGP